MPDLKTQERRDLFHIHRKAVKRTTQLRNRLQSYLSDNGVRLAKGTSLAKAETSDHIRKAREWLPQDWQRIEGLLMELHDAEKQRQHWRSLIAQEVLADPLLYRSCGSAACERWLPLRWAPSSETSSVLSSQETGQIHWPQSRVR